MIDIEKLKFVQEKREKGCLSCGSPIAKAGYCNRHYLQMYRHGKIFDRTKYDGNIILLDGDVAKIEIYDRYGNLKCFATIDSDMIEIVDKYKWHISGNGYASTHINNITTCLHKVLMGTMEGLEMDHIDRNKLNNCSSNLRFVTHQDNIKNSDTRNLKYRD